MPPFNTGNGTPLRVTPNVPLPVTGVPDTDKNDGTVIPTLDTLPVPAPMVVLVSSAFNKVIVLLELTFINLSVTLFVKVNKDIPLVVPPKVILAFAAVVAPVPPFASCKALPLNETANVPLVVIGEPVTCSHYAISLPNALNDRLADEAYTVSTSVAPSVTPTVMNAALMDLCIDHTMMIVRL